MRHATPILLANQCSYCRIVIESSAVFNCSVCKVVSYCSPAHQAAERPSHEVLCIAVQQAEEESQEQSLKLQTKCFQCFGIEDAEHDHVWEWKDIRSYVQARLRHITTFCSIPTEPALQTALYHAHAIIRLNPSDNLDMKLLIPGITMRLGMDMEAYGFIRRHRQASLGCQYAWAHMDLVPPEPQIEDKSEDQGSIESLDHCVPLPFRISLTLLSLRLLFCLRDLENSTMLRPKLPLELVHLIQDHLVTAAVKNDSKLWSNIRAGASLHNRIATLGKRLVDMFDVIRAQEPTFCQTLVQSVVSQEAQIDFGLEQCIQAWSETPGALRWMEFMIRSISQRRRDGNVILHVM